MIRQYEKCDLPAIKEIGRRAWDNIFRAMRKELGDDVFGLLYPDPAAAKEREIAFHAENHPDWMIVCEIDRKIVGFLNFSICGKIGRIGNNAVDPECILKGIGQRMYQAVFQRFRESGVELAVFTTGQDEAHAPARRAYCRAGFQPGNESITCYKLI